MNTHKVVVDDNEFDKIKLFARTGILQSIKLRFNLFLWRFQYVASLA